MTEVDATQRLERVAEFIMLIAEGHFETWMPPTTEADELDAVIVGLNMLAEELAAEREMRQQAEAMLRDELDAYERAPGMFATVDPDSLLIQKCNQTLADALGRDKADLLGLSVLDLHEPDEADAVRRILGSAIAERPAGSGEVRLRAAGDVVRIADLDVRRVEGPDGARLRLIWRDVTVERELADQLSQAQKLDAIGRLSGGLAHDFNNLLAVITGTVPMLREELGDRADLLEDLDLIQGAADRGAALTRDLLAFSRKGPTTVEPSDLAAALPEAGRLVRRLLPETIRLELTTTATSAVVNIDRSQFSQVLLNMAINARDAMPEGGTLSVRLDVSGGAATLVVTDTGTGMTGEVATRAFEPFFTTKSVGAGTGLGLSVCYGIVTRAGGTLDLETAPGMGTTIRVRVPLAAAPEVGAESPVPGITSPLAARVLVVEDEPAVRQVTCRILARQGYEVLEAAHGAEALDVMNREPHLDLVVTDLRMPEMGGAELARAMRATRTGLPVLFVSGYVDEAAKPDAAAGGPSAFLPKPFSAHALLAEVRELLDRVR